MGTRRFDVDRVQRLTGSHEKPISPRPTETDIRAGFGKADHADAVAAGCNDLNARARASPDVPVHVAADPVGRGRRAGSGDVELNEPFAVAKPLAVHIPPLDVAGHTGVGDVELLIVG